MLVNCDVRFLFFKHVLTYISAVLSCSCCIFKQMKMVIQIYPERFSQVLKDTLLPLSSQRSVGADSHQGSQRGDPRDEVLPMWQVPGRGLQRQLCGHLCHGSALQAGGHMHRKLQLHHSPGLVSGQQVSSDQQRRWGATLLQDAR